MDRTGMTSIACLRARIEALVQLGTRRRLRGENEDRRKQPGSRDTVGKAPGVARFARGGLEQGQSRVRIHLCPCLRLGLV